MKYPYPDITTTSVKGMRFYEIPGDLFYPSITTILGGTMSEAKSQSLKRWENSLGVANAKAFTKSAADHGTAVHLLIERHLRGEELVRQNENISPQNINAFNALKTKLKKIDEIYGQEVALFSHELAVAGRCDCIGVFKGQEAIIDFKTSTRLKSKKDIEDYRYQLTAYAIMHNEMFGTNIEHGIILMTSAAGFPQEFKVNLVEYVDPVFDRVQEFYKKLDI